MRGGPDSTKFDKIVESHNFTGSGPEVTVARRAMVSSDSLKIVAPIVTERGEGDLVAARYRLLRKIGAGGMGSVWYAQDLSLDAPCAVKLIDGEKAYDEGIRLRFEREAKASAQLRSAHVVNVFDYGEWNRTQYLAMEYLDGEDLSVRLAGIDRLDFASTYRVIAHVSRALMAAHAVGIVHRDLKPENIFLVQNYDEEIAKVLDFGIAQHNAYSLKDRATREGAFLGTPCYVSPEQARGRLIDHRSDLWSLGVIAFQCLTGRLPFEGTALGELMGQILYEPLPIPSAICPDLPVAFDDWWLRAAARRREDRFQSAKEMADQLGVALGIESVVLVPTTLPHRRASMPPAAEYSGVITAARTPEAAVRTTALAPESQSDSDELTRSQAEAQLPLTSEQVAESEHEEQGNARYIARLAAEPLKRMAKPKPRASADSSSPSSLPPNDEDIPESVEPELEDLSPPVGTPWHSAQAQVEKPAYSFSQYPRTERDSSIRIIEQQPSARDSVALASQRVGVTDVPLPSFADRGWRDGLAQLTIRRPRAVLLVPIAGALLVICTVLLLALRNRSSDSSTTGEPPRSATSGSPAGVGSPTSPKLLASAETLTVDMLPLIKNSNGKTSSDTSGKVGDSDGADPNKKPEPNAKPTQKSPRPVQPARDYGI